MRSAFVAAAVVALLAGCGQQDLEPLPEIHEMQLRTEVCVVDRYVSEVTGIPSGTPVSVQAPRYTVMDAIGYPDFDTAVGILQREIKVWIDEEEPAFVPFSAVAPCQESERAVEACRTAFVAAADGGAGLEAGTTVDVAVPMVAEEATGGDRHVTWVRGQPPVALLSEKPLDCGRPAPAPAEMRVLTDVCVVDDNVAEQAGLPLREAVNVQPLRYRQSVWGELTIRLVPELIPLQVEVWETGGAHEFVPPTAVAPCDEAEQTAELCSGGWLTERDPDAYERSFELRGSSVVDGTPILVGVPMEADIDDNAYHTWLRRTPAAVVLSDARPGSC